jgi:hypothetical protein
MQHLVWEHQIRLEVIVPIHASAEGVGSIRCERSAVEDESQKGDQPIRQCGELLRSERLPEFPP